MKQWGITLLVVAFSILIGLGLALFMLKRVSADTEIPKTAEEKPSASQTIPKNMQFIWGAHAGAYSLNKKIDTYSSDRAIAQINKAKELGVNLVRANLETQISYTPNFSVKYMDQDNDDYIDKLKNSDLDVMLVLDPDIPKTISKTDYFAQGYSMGSYASKRYQSKVKYYQLANEVSGTIAKPKDYTGPTFKGEAGIDYSQERYDATLAWIKGMAKGIRENDPEAKLIVSGHWVLYDIIGKLINDGADFDIVGWAWYSSDGTDVTNREFNYGHSLNLAQKLSDYKKDVWIVEANRDGGSYSEKGKAGESDQADFFAKILKNIYSTNLIKGFVAFTLFDNTVAGQIGNPQDGALGLVKVSFENDQNVIKYNKQAFTVYKNFIRSHLRLPTALLAKPSPVADQSSQAL